MENNNNQFPNPSSDQRPPITPRNTGPLPPPTPPQKGRKKGSNSGGNGSGNNVKILQIATIVLALALVGSLIYIYMATKQSKEQIEVAIMEKEQVMHDLEQLKDDYGQLKVDNDTLSTQLDSERQKIEVLMERIKTTEATNRRQMLNYQREITNLKGLLTGYVHQIDSLNLLTRELRAENERVKTQMSQSKKQVEQLSQETTALKSMVEKGGELKTRDITVTALTNRDKVATRARQTEQLKICLTLIENSIAKRGSRIVYVRVKSPDGSLLTQSVTNLFDPTAGGAQLIYSAMREVDYNGDDLEVCVYYKDTDFMPGAYNIEVFLDGTFVGSTQFTMK